MRRFTIPAIPLISAGVVVSLSAFGWQDTNSRLPTPAPASDHVSSSVRAARNDLFAPVMHSFPSLLDQSPGAPPVTTVVHGSALPELPVAMSQLAVVGKVASITPWMISGNKGLYSEYQIAVNSVLMNRSGWQQAGTLDLVEIGGSAQLPLGRVVAHLVSGVGHQIESGSTYLLFLNYQAGAQCFTFVKVWGVSSGRAAAVANDDLVRVKQNTSTVAGLLLSDLIAQVQAVVSAVGK
jgi:hypothetical protein